MGGRGHRVAGASCPTGRLPPSTSPGHSRGVGGVEYRQDLSGPLVTESQGVHCFTHTHKGAAKIPVCVSSPDSEERGVRRAWTARGSGAPRLMRSSAGCLLEKLPGPRSHSRGGRGSEAAGARPPVVHTCPPTWMYFMNRWHFPQRERGLPVAARGEKDTSISSSMPASQRGGSHGPAPAAASPKHVAKGAPDGGWRHGEGSPVCETSRVHRGLPARSPWGPDSPLEPGPGSGSP